MSKDILVLSRESTQRSLDSRNRLKELEDMFAEDDKKIQEQRAAKENREINIIFALDATFSRSKFWEISKDVQASMFSTAARIRGRFSTQLVYYSGLTLEGNIAASPWYQHAGALSDEMEAVRCQPAATQIGKVFRHAINENFKRRVNALILVADSCEENEQDLVPLARELKRNGMQFFLFDDGNGSTQRHEETGRIFDSITEAAGGEKIEFYIENLHVLSDYLKAVAARSTGDLEAVQIAYKQACTPEGRAFAEKQVHKVMLLTGREP